MFIDVHCHLDLLSDIQRIIDSSKKKGVGLIITNGVGKKTNRKCLEFSDEFREVKAALGIYPIESLEMTDEEISDEIKFILENSKKVTAIGEVGLDYKEDNENHDRQKDVFKKIISLSLRIDKPIIVHSRKAEEDCINILEESRAKKVIMHCFSGKFKLVKRIIENGWSLSIPASVKNSKHFQNIVEITPVEQLLCETDSPFLHPDKKFPNTPENVIESYNKISEIKGLSIKDVEGIIERNFSELFNLKK